MRPISSITQDPAFGRALVLPGFVTAHSHAFQRGLRGRAQRGCDAAGNFWLWRNAMYALANALTPESIYTLSRTAFENLAHSGIVAVGEFHYVHHGPTGEPYSDRTIMSDAVIRSALDAGIMITLLRVAYARAGVGTPPEGSQQRFADPTVDQVLADVDLLRARWQNEPRVHIGIAPHSVRAVPREWLTPLAEYAGKYSLPLHMHVAEQQAEIDMCISEHGCRPVELLADAGVLSDRFCAVHATNVTETEAQLLGQARAQVCICPTTERDLGDGLANLGLLRAHRVALSVGVDSHVITDHVEEIRALETHERLRLRRRVTFEAPEGRTLAEQLIVEGSAHGARAIGFEAKVVGRATSWQPSTVVPLESQPALAGVADEDLIDAVVFSGTGLRFHRN